MSEPAGKEYDGMVAVSVEREGVKVELGRISTHLGPDDALQMARALIQATLDHVRLTQETDA